MEEYTFDSDDVIAAMTERLLNSLADDTITLEEAREIALEIREMTDTEIEADGEDDDEQV